MYSQNLTTWSLQELLVWNKWGVVEERFRASCIGPSNWRWKDDAEYLEDVLKRCRKLLAPPVWRFLQEVMASAILTKIADLDEAITKEIFASTFLDQSISEYEKESAKWAVASWVMVYPNRRGDLKGCMGRALIGISESVALCEVPSWLYSVCDKKAIISVENAITIARIRLSPYVLVRPLLMDHDRLQICGPSLGLAVYAGVLCAYKRINVDQQVAFSGGITESGGFTDPGYVRDKAVTARNCGFKTFVYGTCCVGKGGCRDLGIEIIPVIKLEDLEWILISHRAGIPEKAFSMARILDDPDMLATKIEKIDLAIARSTLFSSKYMELVGDVIVSPKNAEVFAKNLAELCNARNYDLDVWEYLVKPLWDIVTGVLGKISPIALWHIGVSGWACADAEGSQEDAEKWRSLANHALDLVFRRQEGLECIADYYNRLFVHTRHLCFHFEESLPVPFSEILEKLEALDRIAKYEAYPVLGRMYGTIAQNYGFCGPRCLNRLDEYVRKAQKAFGDGKIHELRKDWRRGFNYLLYGYLDAGFWGKAENILKVYLGIDKVKDADFSKMGAYETAAFMRFVAEAEGVFVSCDEIMQRVMIQSAGFHPWQLALFNMGRLFNNRDLKRSIWSESLRIALALKGARRVLGFLPLAGLWMEELASEKEIMQGFCRIYEEIKVMKGFNKVHFGELLKEEELFNFTSIENSLRNIWLDRFRLFPFTYR